MKDIRKSIEKFLELTKSLEGSEEPEGQLGFPGRRSRGEFSGSKLMELQIRGEGFFMDFFLKSSIDRFFQRVLVPILLVINRNDLDIPFISEILTECGDWHAMWYLRETHQPHFFKILIPKLSDSFKPQRTRRLIS